MPEKGIFFEQFPLFFDSMVDFIRNELIEHVTLLIHHEFKLSRGCLLHRRMYSNISVHHQVKMFQQWTGQLLELLNCCTAWKSLLGIYRASRQYAVPKNLMWNERILCFFAFLVLNSICRGK